MPVVSIRALPVPALDRSRAATRISEAIAAVAGIKPTDIWVVWSDLAPGSYVIAGSAPTDQPAPTHPPLVEISSASGRPTDVVDAMLAAAARAIGDQLGVPEDNVRVVYAEIPPRRLYSRARYQ
jgi:phenylpyruvate tautomerase PptA (4-oxalocrotonate tautomerase family)